MLKQIGYWLIVLWWTLLAIAVIDCEKKIEAYKVDTAPVIHVEKRVKTGIASHYAYQLKGLGWWSETHRTAASRTLKRYSTHRVTNIDNGKSVDVFINDFGPQSCADRIKNGLDTKETCVEREIDLSSFAFSQIADLKLGLVKVKID